MLNTLTIADVLKNKDCTGKVVDMGFWFDVPHITKQTLKILRERGAVGVRLVLDADMLDELCFPQEKTDKRYRVEKSVEDAFPNPQEKRQK